MLTTTTSPLESLASFAIAFAAGIVSTVAISTYVRWVRDQK